MSVETEEIYGLHRLHIPLRNLETGERNGSIRLTPLQNGRKETLLTLTGDGYSVNRMLSRENLGDLFNAILAAMEQVDGE